MPIGKEFRSDFLLPLVTVALTAAVFALDLVTPLGIADGILYLLPLLLTVWLPQRNAPLLLATVFTGLILLGALLSSPSASLATWGANRAMSIVGLWAAAVFLVQRGRTEAAFHHEQEALERRVIERTADLQRAINFLEKDIAERKQDAENLARLAAIVESSDDAIIGKSLDGIVLSWNQGAERLFGYTAQEIIGKPITILIPPDHIDEETRIIEHIKQSERIEHFETVRRRKDGQPVDVSLTISPIKDAAGTITGISKIARDITERRQAHDALRLAYARLLDLTIRLDSAQEEERKHISREIHDELGQSLTALKLDLSWLNKRLSEMAKSVPRSNLLDKVRSMLVLLDSTKQTVRRVATSLRLRVLDDLGLVASLKAQAAEFQDHTGVRCDVAISPQVMEMQIDSAHSTALFRIAQELLTNVMRHAQASKVRIEFAEEAGKLILQVHDDGRGITEGDIANTASLGLVGIRERASRLGGDFTIKDKPEKGSVAIVRIPISPAP